MDVPKNLFHPDPSFSSSSQRRKVPKDPQSAPVFGSEKQVSSTPYRYSAGRANIAAYKETHKVMDHLVVGEIKDACFRDLTRLEEVTLTNDSITFDPNDIFEQLKKSDPGIFKLDAKTAQTRWADWPDAVSAPDSSFSAEEALAKCINRIGQAVAKILELEDAPRKWSAKFCNKPVGNDRCKRKPDLALIRSEDAETTDTSQNWSKIFAVGELKSGVSPGRTIEQLAQYARLIFGEQPDRMHVLGFAVHRDNVYYAFFNRAGAFTSDEFDVHEQPERLLRVVVGMMFAGREAIGFDPTMKMTRFDEAEVFEPYINVGESRYTIVELLHIESVIRGRATTVYKVKKPKQDENDKDEFLVVKNGWVDCDRRKENDILGALEGIPYIPKVVAHHTSTITTRKHFGDWRDLSIKNRLDTVDIYVEQREQVRVAITPVGTSIVDFKSLKELVHIFITIVDAIDELHKKNHLHRDISLRNVLINNSSKSKDGLRDGLLIDFDYAIEDLPDRAVSGVHRTGTLPYMSVELLTAMPGEPLRHAFYHDLESLFYVMCYVCCICAGPNRTLRDDIDIFNTPIGKWFGKKNQTEADVGKAKHDTVSPSSDFVENISPVFHKYFSPLKPYLRKLSSIAVPPHAKVIRSRLSDEDSNDDNESEEGRENEGGGKSRIKSVYDLPLKYQPMNIRGLKQMKKFRGILQEAFEALPDDITHPNDEPQIASDVCNKVEGSPVAQSPTIGDIRSPGKVITHQDYDNDGLLLRIMDLIPPENALEQGGSQVENLEDSNTLVEGDGEQSRSGKRKMQAMEEGEDSNSDEVESMYVRGTSPSPSCGIGKTYLTLGRSSTRTRSSRSGTRGRSTRLASIVESSEGNLSVDLIGERRSGSRGSKRLRSRLEEDGQSM